MRITIALTGALCLVVAGCTGNGDREAHEELAPTTTTTTTTAPPPPAVTGVLLGASTSPETRGVANEKLAVEELEAHLGRTLDIDHNFYTWDDPFPGEIDRWDSEGGRIPMISWNGRGVTTRAIAAGRHDGLIRQRARDTRAYGDPVLIRWFWEMDGNKKAEFAGTPEEYAAAWRHIVKTFRQEGADNVRWVWCPNASAFDDGEAQPFYPGDDVVDWICADGYNWAPGRPGDRWETFKEIFGGFYAWASLHDKPIMIGEFGVQERGPGERARWIDEARETIKNDFPLIRAIVYFHANKDYDWRLTPSPSAIAAFRRLANDPWFNVSPFAGPDRPDRWPG